MSKKSIAVYFSLALLLACPSAFAQNEEAFPFLKIQRNPAALTAGTAGVTPGPWGVSAVNAFYEGTAAASLSYSRQKAAPSSDVDFAALYRIAENLTANATFSLDNGQKYDLYNRLGRVSGSFTPKEIIIGAGVSYLLRENLSLGATFKYASQSLSSDASYSAVAADVFVAGRFAGLTATAGVSSLGSKVTSSSGDRYSLPSSGALGVGYGLDLMQGLRLNAQANADFYFSGAFAAGAGAELTYRKFVSLRAGYNYGGKSVIPSYGSLGAGVKLFGASLDFTYYLAGSDSPLAGSFAVGLRYDLKK